MYYHFNAIVHRQHLTELEGLTSDISKPTKVGPPSNWRIERELETVGEPPSSKRHVNINKPSWFDLVAALFGTKRVQL